MFRRKLFTLVFTVISVFIILIGFWYIDFDQEYTFNRNYKEYLSHSEAEKAALHYNPSKEYFYEISFVENRTKTKIPFIYKYDTISSIKKDLMSDWRQ